MSYLLDTNVLSELRRKMPNIGVVDWFSQRPDATVADPPPLSAVPRRPARHRRHAQPLRQPVQHVRLQYRQVIHSQIKLVERLPRRIALQQEGQ